MPPGEVHARESIRNELVLLTAMEPERRMPRYLGLLENDPAVPTTSRQQWANIDECCLYEELLEEMRKHAPPPPSSSGTSGASSWTRVENQGGKGKQKGPAEKMSKLN